MSRLDRARIRFAERTARRMFEQVTTASPSRPGRGAAGWAALGVAIVVHLFTAGLVVAAVWLVLGADTIFPVLPILVGLALLGLAFLMRPRLGRLPKDAIVVDASSAPVLHALVRQVTERLDAPPVRRIVLSADYNAGFGAVGVRRRTVLELGLPLWNLLDHHERVALLGHEIGHGVNGDLRHGLLVGSSLRSLDELYLTLGTSTGGHDEGLVMLIAQWFANAITWLLSWPILGLALIQERLLAQSGQRAEYYADHLAAALAGPVATRSMLDKLRLGRPCMGELHTAVIRREPDIWVASRKWVADLTDADRSLLVKQEESRPHRIDSTHPRTRMRIAAIERRDYSGEVLTSNAAEATAVDLEVAAFQRPITEEIRAAAIGR